MNKLILPVGRGPNAVVTIKAMARIRGVQPSEANWFVRFVYWMTKRKIGRIILPVQITAHHPRLLRAMGEMETGQAAAKSVDGRLKEMAAIKAATLVGCPF